MMPDNWKTVRFRDIADYRVGRTPSRANADFWAGGERGVPWVAISDMTEFGTVMDTKEKISRAAFEHVFKGQAVPAGTLIMSFKLTIGRVATLGVASCHNEAIISIYPKPGVDQRYLGYFLGQVDYSALQDRQVKGNTLNQDKIDRIEVWLPPSDEQSTIADVLDLVRHAIEAQDRGLAITDELKRTAMRELFAKGMRGEHQKESELGLIPQGWTTVKLGEICTLSTGTTPATGQKHYYEGDIPFIKTADVVNNRIRAANTFLSKQAIDDYSLKIFPPGTVLMAMYGQGKTRGQVSLLQIAAATTQNAAAIQPSGELDSAYLWHYLLSSYDRLRGMGSLGHVSHLNLGYLRDLQIIKPSLEEQRDIATFLDAIDQKTELHRSKRVVLQELFEALLCNLMTAQIRVADLNLSTLASPSMRCKEVAA
jgi:type I restriction enzyme S subunit